MATLRPVDPPHPGIRNAFSRLSLAAGSTATMDSNAVDALVALALNVLDFLDEQAEFKEKVILESPRGAHPGILHR